VLPVVVALGKIPTHQPRYAILAHQLLIGHSPNVRNGSKAAVPRMAGMGGKRTLVWVPVMDEQICVRDRLEGERQTQREGNQQHERLK
jgi:hypothetical protein